MIVATKILSSSIKLCAQPNRASGSSDLMTQTMKLVFVFCLMLIGAVSKVSSADSCNRRSDVGNVRLLSLQRSTYEGVVQICNTFWWFGRHFDWHYVTTNGWTNKAAQVVCRQLDLPHSTAQSVSVRLYSMDYQVTGLAGCNKCNERLSQCLPQTYGWHVEISPKVAALNCYCQDKALRLVGGSTNKEGRVEMCIDGRWGAIKVCREPNRIAEVVGILCYRLGFSRENANFHYFGIGSGPTHNIICTSPNPDDCIPLKIPANSKCENYSQPVGVRCQAREDACTTIITDTPTPGMLFTADQTVGHGTAPVSPTANTSEERISAPETTDIERGITNPADVNNSNTSLLTSSTNTGCAVVYLNENNTALGVLTGLLTAALVVVAIGWSVSCVYWYRKFKQTNGKTQRMTSGQCQLVNPLYDSNTGTQPQINYCSLGPAYEHVEANNQTGYDVINRRGAPRPHPPMTPPGSHDPTSDGNQDYSILEGNNYYNVMLESSNRSSAGQHQEGGEHNQQEPSNEQEPQDYEVPISGTRGVHHDIQ